MAMYTSLGFRSLLRVGEGTYKNGWPAADHKRVFIFKARLKIRSLAVPGALQMLGHQKAKAAFQTDEGEVMNCAQLC